MGPNVLRVNPIWKRLFPLIVCVSELQILVEEEEASVPRRRETEVQHAFPADRCFDFGPRQTQWEGGCPSLGSATNRKAHVRWMGENTFLHDSSYREGGRGVNETRERMFVLF